MPGVGFGQEEVRSGPLTKGKYEVKLPDGRLQSVNYHVNDINSGFVADVNYSKGINLLNGIKNEKYPKSAPQIQPAISKYPKSSPQIQPAIAPLKKPFRQSPYDFNVYDAPEISPVEDFDYYYEDYAPESTYKTPESSYGAPENTYRTPESSYGAPENNFQSPSSSYGRAKTPESSYGARENTYRTPESSYGAPESTYKRPGSFYGAPENNYQSPSSLYGRPKTPESSYGAPESTHKPPKNSYGAPENTYKKPQDNYLTYEQSYGTPTAPKTPLHTIDVQSHGEKYRNPIRPLDIPKINYEVENVRQYIPLKLPETSTRTPYKTPAPTRDSYTVPSSVNTLNIGPSSSYDVPETPVIPQKPVRNYHNEVQVFNTEFRPSPMDDYGFRPSAKEVIRYVAPPVRKARKYYKQRKKPLYKYTSLLDHIVQFYFN